MSNRDRNGKLFSNMGNYLSCGGSESEDSSSTVSFSSAPTSASLLPPPSAEKTPDHHCHRKLKAEFSSMSPILRLTHQNDAIAIKKLLEEGPLLVSTTDHGNGTPLHVVSLCGWIDVVGFILEFGADVNVFDRWRNTPLDAAAAGTKK